MWFPQKNKNIVINQKIIVYIPWPAVIILPFPIKACLNAVTKYVNGKHCNILRTVWCSAIIVSPHTTGVAQKNSCITIDNRLEKSGTNVVIADVNLVNDIIKAFRDLGYLVEEDMLGKHLSQMPDYYLDYLFKLLYGYDFNTHKNLN